VARRAFDHFMVHTDIGRNRKLRRRFSVEERWCYVAGVLVIAATSPIRGRLLIGGDPAGVEDIADEAGVKLQVARSTLDKLRSLEMVYPDPELDCERVHDFEDHNPEPKKDPTAADRMRRHRDRLRRNDDRNKGRNTNRNGVRNNGRNSAPVTHPVTPTEVEEEGKSA
jgi:hypothetical protein